MPQQPDQNNAPSRAPQIIKNQRLPTRWIIAGVVVVHLGVFILFGSQSDRILRKQDPVEPQNFYHAEEVYEVQAGPTEELVRVREYTVSTELHPREGEKTDAAAHTDPAQTDPAHTDPAEPDSVEVQ
jgi:hypothetical protein